MLNKGEKMTCTSCNGEIDTKAVSLMFEDPEHGNCSTSFACAHICKNCGKAHYGNGQPIVVIQHFDVFQVDGKIAFAANDIKHPVFVPPKSKPCAEK
jgi:hypothetical protein